MRSFVRALPATAAPSPPESLPSVFHGIEQFGIDADSAGELGLRQTKPSTHALFSYLLALAITICQRDLAEAEALQKSQRARSRGSRFPRRRAVSVHTLEQKCQLAPGTADTFPFLSLPSADLPQG
jgi:hypothetical protein